MGPVRVSERGDEVIRGEIRLRGSRLGDLPEVRAGSVGAADRHRTAECFLGRCPRFDVPIRGRQWNHLQRRSPHPPIRLRRTPAAAFAAAFFAAIAKSLAIASGPLRGPALITPSFPLQGKDFCPCNL